MCWCEEQTVFYTKATHSIDKIAQASDAETEQVYIDEQGQLKVQVVIGQLVLRYWVMKNTRGSLNGQSIWIITIQKLRCIFPALALQSHSLPN